MSRALPVGTHPLPYVAVGMVVRDQAHTVLRLKAFGATCRQTAFLVDVETGHGNWFGVDFICEHFTLDAPFREAGQ